MKGLSMLVGGVAILAIATLSCAQAANDPASQQQIQMHESMIKIHQDAVTCLKSNKTSLECQEQFRQQMMNFMQQQQAMMQGMMQNRPQQPGQAMPAAPMAGQMPSTSGQK